MWAQRNEKACLMMTWISKRKAGSEDSWPVPFPMRPAFSESSSTATQAAERGQTATKVQAEPKSTYHQQMIGLMGNEPVPGSSVKKASIIATNAKNGHCLSMAWYMK